MVWSYLPSSVIALISFTCVLITSLFKPSPSWLPLPDYLCYLSLQALSRSLLNFLLCLCLFMFFLAIGFCLFPVCLACLNLLTVLLTTAAARIKKKQLCTGLCTSSALPLPIPLGSLCISHISQVGPSKGRGFLSCFGRQGNVSSLLPGVHSVSKQLQVLTHQTNQITALLDSTTPMQIGTFFNLSSCLHPLQGWWELDQNLASQLQLQPDDVVLDDICSAGSTNRFHPYHCTCPAR